MIYKILVSQKLQEQLPDYTTIITSPVCLIVSSAALTSDLSLSLSLRKYVGHVTDGILILDLECFAYRVQVICVDVSAVQIDEGKTHIKTLNALLRS